MSSWFKKKLRSTTDLRADQTNNTTSNNNNNSSNNSTTEKDNICTLQIDEPFPGIPLRKQHPAIKKRLSSWINHTAATDILLVTASTTSACTCVQGKRKSMEDKFFYSDALDTKLKCNGNDNKISFFGVYDGHCGAEAAEICKDIVHTYILESDSFCKGNIIEGIYKGFEEADKFITVQAEKGKWKAGSCATIAILYQNCFYVANLGDSLLVLAQRKCNNRWFTPSSEEDVDKSTSNEYLAIDLCAIHKATEASEKERIQQQGGIVMRGRLFGDLAVTRAFGDVQYKKPISDDNFVSAVPHVAEAILQYKQHNFAIVSSDGLWDKVTQQEAVDIVAKEIHEKNNCDPANLSKILVDLAFERGSSDNITTIVILFNWKIHHKSGKTPRNNKIEKQEEANANANTNANANANTNDKKEEEEVTGD